MQSQLQQAYEDREEFLKQKSRIQLDEAGDSNTRFFHLAFKDRAQQNHIRGILKGDVWVSKLEEVNHAIFAHFKEFYNPEITSDIFSLGSLNFKKLSASQINFLSRDFQLPEIHSTLMSMNSNKAPGPDGVNSEYHLALWNVSHEDILLMFKRFGEHKILPIGVNSSFIVLIPKKESPRKLTDYRPISLINFSLKILLKMLANRLSTVLSSLILEVQSGFVKGRTISNWLIIANEIVHSNQNNKVQCIVLKLNFAKTFDIVKCCFLFHTFDRMSFL